MPYLLVRYFQDPNKNKELIGRVDTLEEAQEHCNDPETSSRAATGEEAREITAQYGPWFDGFEEI